MSPREFVPTSSSQLQWPQWGLFAESAGRKGSAPDLDAVRRLAALARRWRAARDAAAMREAWRAILRLNAEQVFSIGLVNGAPQPVVVSARLRNVPERGIYAFAPMSYFGVYMPDTFWFDDAMPSRGRGGSR